MNIKKGFTLIEVIIVMAIIAILATFSIPSYKNYVLRANRAQGLSILQANMLAIEQFRTRQLRYPSNDVEAKTVTGYKATSQDSSTAKGYIMLYNYNSTNDIATITMYPNSYLKADETMCRTISINSNEVQSATNVSLADTSIDCWTNTK